MMITLAGGAVKQHPRTGNSHRQNAAAAVAIANVVAFASQEQPRAIIAAFDPHGRRAGGRRACGRAPNSAYCVRPPRRVGRFTLFKSSTGYTTLHTSPHAPNQTPSNKHPHPSDHHHPAYSLISPSSSAPLVSSPNHNTASRHTNLHTLQKRTLHPMIQKP